MLTRDASFAREGVEAVRSVEEALECVSSETAAWVIGGGEIYRQMLPYCTVAEVTRNQCSCEADTYFPDLDACEDWHVSAETSVRELAEGEGTPGLHYQFVSYARVS